MMKEKEKHKNKVFTLTVNLKKRTLKSWTRILEARITWITCSLQTWQVPVSSVSFDTLDVKWSSLYNSRVNLLSRKRSLKVLSRDSWTLFCLWNKTHQQHLHPFFFGPQDKLSRQTRERENKKGWNKEKITRPLEKHSDHLMSFFKRLTTQVSNLIASAFFSHICTRFLFRWQEFLSSWWKSRSVRTKV